MLVLAYDYETCAKSIFFVFPSLSLSRVPYSLPPCRLSAPTCCCLPCPGLACWLLYTLYRRGEREGSFSSSSSPISIAAASWRHSVRHVIRTTQRNVPNTPIRPNSNWSAVSPFSRFDSQWVTQFSHGFYLTLRAPSKLQRRVSKKNARVREHFLS